MARSPADDVRRPRPGRARIVGPALALAACALLGTLLVGLAWPQFAETARQAGRPGVDAVVVTCPPSGGSRGMCAVSVARDGHDLVPLAYAGFLFPQPGDVLPVVIESERGDDGTPWSVAELAGWRSWAASAVLLAALLTIGRVGLAWGRRVLVLFTPSRGARSDPAGAAAHESEADGRAQRRRVGGRRRNRYADGAHDTAA